MSIITQTTNGARTHATFGPLGAQDIEKGVFEVIVVDNGSMFL